MFSVVKKPKDKAGTKLKELAKKRRENTKPPKELLEVLRAPSVDSTNDKKSALPYSDKDLDL